VFYVGTDEAGYGPLLGPLVIAATVFESSAPRASLAADGVGDSKQVYGRHGRAGLARVLAPCFGSDTLRLSALLATHSVRPDPRPAYPWYGESEEAVEPSGSLPGFRALRFNPVCEREFNEACARDGSKGTVLFRETMRVMRGVIDTLPEGAEVDVLCDKHGGRRRYADLLMAELGPSSLLTERESAAHSSYRLKVDGRPMRIRFLAKADALDPPVSLASMTAKFVRELFMEALNEFFGARRGGLRPTAGYTVDGRRFLEDVRPVLEDLGVPLDCFVRSR
jgi:ribonuclease HII